MALGKQNHIMIPPKQATNKVPKCEPTFEVNPAQNRSAAPLYLDKSIESMRRPSV